MPAAMVVTIRHHVRHIVIIVASLRAAGESELESTFKQLEVRFVSRDQGDSSIVTIDRPRGLLGPEFCCCTRRRITAARLARVMLAI